jgi:non-ribosomal peptide synthetase component E (peptide arylation enzyme)
MHWIDLDDPQDRTLISVLRRQAEEVPDETYMLAGAERYSFARVYDLVNRYAAALHGLGVRKGDTVAFLMRSCE